MRDARSKFVRRGGNQSVWALGDVGAPGVSALPTPNV